MPGHCIGQNLKAQCPTQLRMEAPDTSSLSVSMRSHNTGVTGGGGGGRPVREWTGPPPTLKKFEEPLMEKPTLRGNVLPCNVATTSSFALLGQQGPVLTQRDSITPQSAPEPSPVCVSTDLRADHSTAPAGTAAPPILLGSLGITWSGGGHLSHEQICGQKDATQLSHTPWP